MEINEIESKKKKKWPELVLWKNKTGKPKPDLPRKGQKTLTLMQLELKGEIQQTLRKSTGVTKHFKKLHFNKLAHSEEMDRFLHTQNSRRHKYV